MSVVFDLSELEYEGPDLVVADDPKVLDALRRVVQKKGVKLEGSREPVKLAG